MKAYWFSKDGRPMQGRSHIIYMVGNSYTEGGIIIPCENGLHASVDPFDALVYSFYPSTLDIVELDGTIVGHGTPVNKYAASQRRHLDRIPVPPLLKEFARWCALQVIHLWECPDIVKRYLETGDDSLANAAEALTGIIWQALEDAGNWVPSLAAKSAYQAIFTATDLSVGRQVVSAATYAADAVYRDHPFSVNDAHLAFQNTRAAQRVKFQELVDKAFEVQNAERIG